jgi:hypothetical protein
MTTDAGDNGGDGDGGGEGGYGGSLWHLPHVFLRDMGLSHTQGPVAILDTLPSILCRHPWLPKCLWWWWEMEEDEVVK